MSDEEYILVLKAELSTVRGRLHGARRKLQASRKKVEELKEQLGEQKHFIDVLAADKGKLLRKLKRGK